MAMNNDIKAENLIDPQERLKHLINYSNAIEVDFRIPATKYYQSGLQMVRMANVYYTEGSLENAYVLYLKFMTLFLEKIRKHPDFDAVPLKTKAINQAKVREVLPKAEKVKARLLHQYKEEYKRYLQQEASRKMGPSNTSQSRDGESSILFSSDKMSSETGKKTDEVTLLEIETYPDVHSVVYPPDPSPSTPSVPSYDEGPSSIDTPLVDRSKKPSLSLSDSLTSSFIAGGATYAANSGGLRTVIVPTMVMRKFQHLSQKNTVNNIETCGILAGKLSRNELFITHLILPKQKGTSDSCITMDEEEIFDFQDRSNLITIGWIHTHPTQTTFLSSVDLHTHCPYQLLMPEAIAIVCAPRYNETGFFVLTPSHGLNFIANCRLSGFHPHPTEPPLFKVAEHIKLEPDAGLEILDLRSDT